MNGVSHHSTSPAFTCGFSFVVSTVTFCWICFIFLLQCFYLHLVSIFLVFLWFFKYDFEYLRYFLRKFSLKERKSGLSWASGSFNSEQFFMNLLLLQVWNPCSLLHFTIYLVTWRCTRSLQWGSLCGGHIGFHLSFISFGQVNSHVHSFIFLLLFLLAFFKDGDYVPLLLCPVPAADQTCGMSCPWSPFCVTFIDIYVYG